MNQSLNYLAAGTDIPWLWISARTFGICAWAASSLVVIIGLMTAGRMMPSMIRPATRVAVHRTFATLTLVFVVGHVLTLLPDPYAQLSVLDVFVPGLAVSQTFATALGTAAFLVLAGVAVAGSMRDRMSRRSWRTVHMLAYAVWPLVTVHYILMGTDAMASWSLAMIGAVALMIAFLLVRRGRGATAPQRPSRTRGRAEGVPGQPGQPGGNPEQAAGVLVRVVEVVRETEHATSFVLEVPADRAEFRNYRAGQHLTVQIPSALTGSVARCYSLSSAPGVDPYLRLTVKRTRDGYASNWLADNVRPGMTLRVLPPAGRFTLPTGHDQLLMFAAGSGITPIISMIKTSLMSSRTRIHLFYANVNESSVIFAAELQDLVDRYPQRLIVTHQLQSLGGVPTPTHIGNTLAKATIIGDGARPPVLVCGPPPFMRLVREVSAAHGWSDELIHSEEFTSLTSDPFNRGGRSDRGSRRPPASQSPAPTDGPPVSGAAPVQVGGHTATLTRTTAATVSLGGQTHRVAWERDETLVDTLLDNGIDVPYSCLEGVCRSCECRLEAGTVESDGEIHTPGKRVLGCQVRPVDSEVLIRFED